MANPNRVKTENYIIACVEQLLPGGGNGDIYRKFFDSLSDAKFQEYMEKLRDGTAKLCLIAPNFKEPRLSTERNLGLAEKWGHNFFQRLWIGAQGERPAYLTPVRYLVVDLPFRRASQTLIKKIRTPEHSRTVDMLTGQPTSDSKGAKLSFPELQVLTAMGMDNSIAEMIKFRGGDVKGGRAFNAMLSKFGTANLKTLYQYGSGVESTKSLKTYLLGCHLRSTL